MDILTPINPNNRNRKHPRFGLHSEDKVILPSQYINGAISDSDKGKFPNKNKVSDLEEVDFSKRIDDFMNVTI
ncbi:MAG: hypothetical protein FWG14_12850 [Peptococcaceae bacterium]|nr:hypothetical protein [Peptococcaceae bacterium]